MSIVLGIIAGYMILMLVIGFYARRFVKTLDDYLLAGRRLGIVLLSATLAATHYGGGFVLGGGAWGVKYGLGGLWYGFACGLGLFILGLTLARPARALAVYTVPDIIDMRYNSKLLRLLATIFSLAALIGIIAAQVWAMAAVFEALGMPGYIGAIIATLVFIVYTAVSGLYAVTLTDFIQIIIGSAGVIAACITSLYMVGGFGGLLERLSEISVSVGIKANYMDLLSPGLTLIAITLVATVMYTLIGQDFYQRLFAAKDPGVAKKASIVSGILLMVLSVIPPLTGMCALALSSNPVQLIESPKSAIPRLILTLFPPVIGGFFIAALLAAIMSTADSLLSAAVSHVVRDLYQQLVNPEADQRTLLRLSITSSIVIGVFALISALTIKDIILLLIYSYDIYTSAVFIPVIMGIYWKRASREGALAALIVGAGVTISGILGIIKLPYWELLYISSAALAALAMTTVSLVKGSTEPSIELKRILEW